MLQCTLKGNNKATSCNVNPWTDPLNKTYDKLNKAS